MKALIKYLTFFSLLFFCVSQTNAQRETSKWKALFALGINSPAQDGLVKPFVAHGTNFPTITIGLQHMLKRQLGVKLDFGYHRFSSADNTPEFKVNYSRINAQLVYDSTPDFTFIPLGMGLIFHAGPGYSSIKPLGFYKENKTSFLNVIGGIEVHKAVSKTVSVFVDGSYIFGLGKEFDPISTGFGSFNGNLFTVTVGLSVSLSGCAFCN